MRGLYAVFRKEMGSFFVAPIAYVVIASFLFISGFFFWANISFMSILSLQATANPMLAERINPTDVVVRPLAQNLGIVLLFVTPLLTMRLFSEEKKSGAIELLLTYPITDTGVTVGKFLAAAFVLLVMLVGTGASVLLLMAIGKPDMGTVVSCYLGLFLMGMAFMALGTFISSLTENQIISAVVTFGAALLCWIMSWTSTVAGETAGAIIKELSILEHMDSFNRGVLSLGDISFFVLFTAFFLFLTVRSVEAHRWRG
jgi:ABC-2 type transport system permease protein